MMKITKLILRIVALLALNTVADSTAALAQPMHPEWRDQAPYGDYCPGYKKRWYGAKISVKTADEAKKILQEYFSKDEVKIGLITERKWFFRAEILDKNDVLVDVAIVDKRTGRIRSIY